MAEEQESLYDCVCSSNQLMTKEALEEKSIDCSHKKVFDRWKEGLVVMSVDYKSNEAVLRNGEALEGRSIDCGNNPVYSIKEALGEMLRYCRKGTAHS